MRMSIGYLEPFVVIFWYHICAYKFMQAYFSYGNPFPVTRLPVLSSVTD